MNTNQKSLLKFSVQKAFASIALVEASMKRCKNFKFRKHLSPKELEPFDALINRFTRAVEVSIKCFRSIERFEFGENSDTLRDLLNRMEKMRLISSTALWIEIRDVRNRIIHEYLPEKVKSIYDDVTGKMAGELIQLKKKLFDKTRI